MNSNKLAAVLLGAAAVLAAVPVSAKVVGQQSGNYNGLTWKAQSTIIGQTPTSDVLPPRNTVGGGDPIYKPSANKSGTVALIMDYGGGNLFICSGSLLNDRRSIATAGHCVSGGAGTANPLTTTAYFFDGDADARTPFGPGVAIDVSRYYVNPGYTGEVIDQNDIAILRLSSFAPTTAQSYGLHLSDLTGTDFNVAGYGTRSTVGGAVGNTAPFGARTGYLREGDNMYDFRLGDAAFGGVWNIVFGGTADYDYSYLSDFDNGLSANDTACLTSEFGLGLPTGSFCDTGRGAREVGIAGGDSGGPGFVNGKLASVNSYGLTFGTDFGPLGDVDNSLNSSFGEFSGYVPIYIHEDWINSVVPEPASWAMMIAGFGLVGGALRRRRSDAVTA